MAQGSLQLPVLSTVQRGLLKSFWHCGSNADIRKLSSSMRYGALHMPPAVTPYVFRESEDLFPSKCLLLALPPSLRNCQAMNFNLEELLHLSLWICSTLDKSEDLCLSPVGPETIFEARKVHTWLPFHCCEWGSFQMRSIALPGPGIPALSHPGEIWTYRCSRVTCLCRLRRRVHFVHVLCKPFTVFRMKAHTKPLL